MGNSFSHQIISSEHRFLELADPWTVLHQRVNGTIFQTPSWLTSWWKTFRDKSLLRVLAVWEGSALVALAPFFIHEVRRGGFSVRRMSLLGEHQLYGEYAPLALPSVEGYLVDLIAQLLRQELQSGQCDVVDLHQLPSDSFLPEGIGRRLHGQGVVVHFQPRSYERMSLSLPTSWEAYLGRLTSKERRLLRNYERALLKQDVTREILTSPQAIDTGLSELIRLHEMAWQAKGQPGHFARAEGLAPCLRAICSDSALSGYTRLTFFVQNGQRFAGLLEFRSPRCCTLYLVGRDTAHAMAHYSPAKLLMALAIRDAITEGIPLVDFLGGSDHYKFRLGGRLAWFPRLMCWASGPRGMRGAAFGLALKARHIRNRIINHRSYSHPEQPSLRQREGRSRDAG